MYRFKNFLALYKFMDEAEKAEAIAYFEGIISRIGGSRTGNGYHFGHSRLTIQEVIRLFLDNVISERPTENVDLWIEYKDGSLEMIENRRN